VKPARNTKIEKDTPTCAQCEKPEFLCICAAVRPTSTRFKVLILQHPQEPDKLLGTAKAANLVLENSKLKVGLSWPNISKAWGEETKAQDWLVLYLGSGIKSPEGGGKIDKAKRQPLTLVQKNGSPHPEGEQKKKQVKGIIVLDGTWSQAKALWWRNAWLLKCQRAVLDPKHRSLYGILRKEPKGECLSTLETLKETLIALGEPETTGKNLIAPFELLLSKYRETKPV
jgi:DTW domain-containing protein YfiP